MSGSDFAPKYFSQEENQQFGTVLTRLREFEKTISHEFRSVEKKMDCLAKEQVKTNRSLASTKGSITKLRNYIKGSERNAEENESDEEQDFDEEDSEGDGGEEQNHNNTNHGLEIEEIVRLTSHGTDWSTPTPRADLISGNIVSNGLFAFLRGGLMSLNQLWVFACCCFVTFQFALQFGLPMLFADKLAFLNIGEGIIKMFKKYNEYRLRKKRQNRKIKWEEEDEEEKVATGKKSSKTAKAVPLSQRWPSSEIGPKGSAKRQKLKNKRNMENQKFAEIAIAEYKFCDENLRLPIYLNGIRLICLLDTGAHTSLTDRRIAKKMGIKIFESSHYGSVVGVGHNHVPVIGKAEVELELAGFVSKINVLIIDEPVKKDGSYDVIIGRTALKRFPLMLDFTTWELRSKENYIMTMENSDKNKNKTGEDQRIRNILAGVAWMEANETRKFQECIEKNLMAFSINEYDLGLCTITAPPILTTTEIPIQAKPYRTPEKYRSELKAHIQKLVDIKVLKESTTPWATSLIIVPKSTGKIRPCGDFRPLNKITIADPYPLPRMEEIIHKAAGKKYYSSLDLTAGFWQIPLDEKSARKFGIITEWGLYESLRLPFGSKNSPSIFQRIMDKIFENIENITVYIDDILIHTNDFISHLKTLSLVFERIIKYNLKLNGEKCKFFKKQCTYLGHTLSENGFQPALDNAEAIKNFPVPKDLKEVKRFLGMASFFRKFISNFASISNPLNALNRGQKPVFKWGVEQANAFDQLKRELSKCPCLKSPDYERDFHLFCDASNIAYGAVLMQTENGTDLYAIGYWSRTLNSSEEKLPATHAELAAIFYAVTYFRPIIFGGKITIHTDHRPIIFLFNKTSNNAKLNRWLMALQEIEPKVVYVEGKANRVADALSRVPIEWNNIKNELPKEDMPYLFTAEPEFIDRATIENETLKDPILIKVLNAIKENWVETDYSDEVKPYYKIREVLSAKGKLLMKNNQIIIPGRGTKNVL